jgi:L-2-hydroxycarboxylate dehydrogenase (NAD+)
MAREATKQVPVEKVRNLIDSLLRQLGCEADIARSVADVFVEANLRGHPGQGLEHFVTVMVRFLKAGAINPNGRPRIVKESGATALVDGDRGPGQVAAIFAADLAVRKAAHLGCSIVGIVNSHDIYMLGYYADRIARSGCVGLIFTNAIPLMRPYGGVQRLLGTNPIAIGMPTAGRDPIVLDMAMSAGLFRHVWLAAVHGEKLPPGLAVGADGLQTTDPVAGLRGALNPLGGPKGYGLALCIALLAGPLVGAAVGRATGPSTILSAELSDSGELRTDLWDRLGKEDFGAVQNGHLVVAINPSAFGDDVIFRNAVTAYINEIKSSPKAPGVPEILVPGERSFREREKNLAQGSVAIEERVWAEALRVSRALHVDAPIT